LIEEPASNLHKIEKSELALKVLETACSQGGERLRIRPKWPIAIQNRRSLVVASDLVTEASLGQSVNDCGAGSSVIDLLMICDEACAALAGRTCDQASGNSMIFVDPSSALYTDT
jgi:hypothetical protein